MKQRLRRISLLSFIILVAAVSDLVRPLERSFSAETSIQSKPAAAVNELASIESALSTVTTRDTRALAGALGIRPPGEKESPDEGAHELEELGDLDADGIPEMVLKWSKLASPKDSPEGQHDESSSWSLYLLAWDGLRWRASRLREGSESFAMKVLPSWPTGARAVAVILSKGVAEVPYPVIFQFKDHVASLVWDGATEESRYEGYAYGTVEFRAPEGDRAPEMIVSGKTDPGWLNFPRASRRGFGARTIYSWDGKAYVARRTEYSANEDYALYRFISALHLHDFGAAYAQIDPQKFLKTDKPSLNDFRKHIQESFQEFLDDQIFEVRESSETRPEDFPFELDLGDKHYVYRPSFTADSRHLLTSLDRKEER